MLSTNIRSSKMSKWAKNTIIAVAWLNCVTGNDPEPLGLKWMWMCLFIVWNPHWVQQTLQFTPLVLEFFLIQSHLLWGEFSICALCCSCSQSLQLSFLVPPGTHHCWVDRGSVIWEACPTPLHIWLVMCYHCVRIVVGSHRYVCSTIHQV